jgi:hypothetical protein
MEQNKTGKYFKYAIGEILLVMIGILLALQVNNWNQKRLDRIEERIVLSNLNDEFTENNLLIISTKEIFKNAQKANRELMALMGSTAAELKIFNLDSLFFESLPAGQFSVSNQSITNIIQGGRLNIIRKNEIINLLYQWEAQLSVVKQREEAVDNWSYEQILPFLSKYISLKEMDNYGNFEWSGTSKLKKDYYPLFQSLEYENLLDNFLYLHLNQYLELEKVEVIANKIIELTKEYKP